MEKVLRNVHKICWTYFRTFCIDFKSLWYVLVKGEFTNCNWVENNWKYQINGWHELMVGIEIWILNSHNTFVYIHIFECRFIFGIFFLHNDACWSLLQNLVHWTLIYELQSIIQTPLCFSDYSHVLPAQLSSNLIRINKSDPCPYIKVDNILYCAEIN